MVWLVKALKLSTFIGMLLGLVGMVVPIFPGITVIWVLALLYGIWEGFGGGSYGYFVAITLLAVVGWLADNVLMGSKARREGGHWLSIALAALAGVVGSLFLTPIGGLLLVFAVLFAVEMVYRRNVAEAWAITRQMAVGWGWAFAVRFGVGLLMIALWLLWAR